MSIIPRMRPLAWLVVCALIGVPCLGILVVGIVAFSVWRGSVPFAPVGQTVQASLSEDERIAWRKLRSACQDKPIRFFGCLTPASAKSLDPSEENCWRCTRFNWDGPQDRRDVVWGWSKVPYSLGNETYAKDDDDQNGPYLYSAAFRTAKERAERIDVRATVVVDLFSGQHPRILRWYWNDGTQTKSSDQPPNRQRQGSLERFLGALMQHAGDL